MAFNLIAIGHGIVRVARGARKQDFDDLYRRIRRAVFGYLRQSSTQSLRGGIFRLMWGFQVYGACDAAKRLGIHLGGFWSTSPRETRHHRKHTPSQMTATTRRV